MHLRDDAYDRPGMCYQVALQPSKKIKVSINKINKRIKKREEKKKNKIKNKRKKETKKERKKERKKEGKKEKEKKRLLTLQLVYQAAQVKVHAPTE